MNVPIDQQEKFISFFKVADAVQLLRVR